MFEDALVESGGKIRTKTKNWSLLTMVLNVLVLASLVIWPLLHPEALPKQLMAILLVAPAPPPPPPPAQRVVPIKSETMTSQLQAPSKIPKVIKMVNESAPSLDVVVGMEEMPNGTPSRAVGSVLEGIETAPIIKQAPQRKLTISSGVMQGNLLQKTLPQYPPIAKAAHVQGTVVLQATISKTGTIENLHVGSGPALLQESALEAVRSWRYRPYLLNGDPVEVETTINVVFNLGD